MKSYSPAHPARLWRMANRFLSSSKQTAWKCKSWFGLCPECWTNSTCLTCKQLQNLIFTQGFTEMRKDCFYFLDDSLWFKRELIWENPLVCVLEHARLNDDSRLFFFYHGRLPLKYCHRSHIKTGAILPTNAPIVLHAKQTVSKIKSYLL